MKNALIIVDIQNDFCQGGLFEIKNSNEVIPIVNEIRQQFTDKFSLVILTQDCHPEDHISFKNSPLVHVQDVEFDELTLKWLGAFPKHCIKNTHGAQYHSDLIQQSSDLNIKKGENMYKEEFSGFSNPEMTIILKDNSINNVFIVGLAYDFCVGFTALDSVANGFTTYVVKDACRSIADETAVEMEENLIKSGVKIINQQHLKEILI